MSKYFEYNPDNGVTETTDIDEMTGLVTIHQQEDVEPLIDRCKFRANHGLTDHGIKKGLWHYASLPTTVVLELRNKGIDVFDKNCSQRLFREINANYPYLKTTAKTHA